MIVAKQMIKTNQMLSVGWSLSIEKILKKIQANQQPSLKWCVKCAIQSDNQQNQHCPALLLLRRQKMLKKPWGQGWVATKLLELKHFLVPKNPPNEKRP